MKARISFFITFVLLVTAAGLFLLFHEENPYPPAIPLQTSFQPTIGDSKATVHVVVFEDPLCNNCEVFHKEAYHKLYSEFIAKGKIRYTLFLVAETPLSEPVVNTFLCVNAQSSPSFFTAIDEFYKNPFLALTKEQLQTQLLQMLSHLNLSINQANFEDCVKQNSFAQKAMQNTTYAENIMGGIIRTPTVYVNGIALTRPSYEEVKDLIYKELK